MSSITSAGPVLAPPMPKEAVSRRARADVSGARPVESVVPGPRCAPTLVSFASIAAQVGEAVLSIVICAFATVDTATMHKNAYPNEVYVFDISSIVARRIIVMNVQHLCPVR